MEMPQSALEGIRILDLGRYQAGPRASLVMGRLGAEVIKIEGPGGDESRSHGPFVRGQSAYWVQYNSGKLSLGLDLRTDKGKEVLSELVKVSDIFIQNFRPGTIQKMGFSYEDLANLNSRIIMVNVSAYGQFGPHRDRIGFDPIGQAISGMMMLTGSSGEPPVRTYNPIIDRITSLHAAIGALAALHDRQHSGMGQSIDVALADSGYSMTEIQCSAYLGSSVLTDRQGNGSGANNVYQTKDGWVLLSAQSNNIWPRLCEAIGADEWIGNQDFGSVASREHKASAIEEHLSKWFATHTVAAAISKLTALDIPCNQVNGIPEATSDPHLQDRELLVEVPDAIAGTIHVSGNPIKMNRSESKVGPAPLPGEHSRQILTSLLGYSEDYLATLEQEGVIYTADS